MTNQTAVIATENLTKVYQKNRRETVAAIKGLTLNVQPGEIFGYLGPNGAGKTTTIRLLLDLIRPTSGRATIFGLDAQAHSVDLHRRIGFLPGELNLWKNLTGKQVVEYISRVRGGMDQAYVRRMTERLQLDLSIRVRSYSSGNRRKLGLVIAMMNQPELLILDEPTNGLDPLMQQVFNEMVMEIKKEGRTIFLSSHIMGEVQTICDRVGILRNGELKAVERVTDMTRADFRWVEMRFRDPVPAGWQMQLSKLNGISDVTIEGQLVRVQLHGDFDPLLRAVGEAYVQDMRVHEPTLEEVFLTFYGNNGQKTPGMEKEAAR